MERNPAPTGRRGRLSRAGISIPGLVGRWGTLSTTHANCPGRLYRPRGSKYSRLATTLFAVLAVAAMVMPQGKAMAATLSVVQDTPSATVDLTADGITDWATWTCSSSAAPCQGLVLPGDSINDTIPYARKSGGQGIGSVSYDGTLDSGGTIPLRYLGSALASMFTWSDGDPGSPWSNGQVNTSGSTNLGLLQALAARPGGTGTGFTFEVTAPATGENELVLHVGNFRAKGRLTARLPGATAITALHSPTSSAFTSFRIQFSADNAGDKLTVEWEDTGSNGTYSNLQILAVTFNASAESSTQQISSSDFSIGRCKTMQSADVNGDGNDDLICPYDYGSAKTATFVQFSNDPAASEWTIWSPPTGSGAFAVGQCKPVQTGDVDGDGKADLICPYDYGGARTKTFVQLSNGETGSQWTGWSPLAESGSFAVGQCKPMQTGDVNGDGKDDLICSYDYSGTKSKTFVQLSNGTTSSSWTAWSPETPASVFVVDQCTSVLTDDVNSDGMDDLICSQYQGDAARPTYVQLSNGSTGSDWAVRGENIALGKTATQSTTYYELVASKAVNGVINGDNGKMAHTQSGVGEWWQVDLGAIYNVSNSEWFNRTDGAMDRMNDYTVQRSNDGVSWTDVSDQTTQMGRPSVVAINAEARYIRLLQNKDTYINFAEARVFGTLNRASPPQPLAEGKYTLESEADGQRKCLIFGGNGNDASPSRYSWAGGGDYCGIPGGATSLLANKHAVFTLTNIDGGELYTIESEVNGEQKCLIFGNNGNAPNPTRHDWGAGSYCGIPGGKNALLANRQAVWRIKILATGKITIESAADGQQKCLIFSNNGNAENPSRHNWQAGAFCGLPGGKDALIANRQAVWIATPIDESATTDPGQNGPTAPTTASPNVDGNLSNSVFAQRLPTPECKGWEDTVGDMANYVAQGANDMAMAELNRWEDMAELAGNLAGDLVSGDFEGMADGIIDYSNQSMIGQFEQGMKWASLAVDISTAVIPDGAVSEFLKDAEKTADVMGPILVKLANPLNSVKQDGSEFGGDLLYMLENIDDPEEFGSAWINWQQQWNPVGSMTYLLTESDPMEGMRKAAARIQRQAEIFSTYIAPFAPAGKMTKFVSKLNDMSGVANLALGSDIEFAEGGGGKKRVLKNLIAKSIGYAELKDKARGFGMACLDELISSGGICDNPVSLLDHGALSRTNTARLNLLIGRTLAEVDAAGARGHPFYTETTIRDVPAIKLGDESSFKLYRPDVEGTSCIVLGDHAYTMLNGGSEPRTLPTLCDVSLDADWWARPVDYKLVWGDNCSGGDDLSIWQPVCPTGYSHVGFVASGESSYRPSPDRIACIKNDAGIFQWVDGNEAAIKWIDDDKGSKAEWDVTLMTRDFAGIPLMYATAGYPTVNQSYLAGLDVPVPLGIPGPDGVFSNMMTFETTTSRIGNAGTDDPVYAVLQNAKGDTHRILLDNPGKDDTESGQTDTYDVYRPSGFGKVTAFELDSAGDDGWNFSSVALRQVSKSLQVETMAFSGGDDYETHTGKAIHCIGSCLSSGPGCGTAVSGQCSFPKAQARDRCSAHPECVALTCNPNRDDCQARRHNTLSGAGGYTSYVGGRWLDGLDGPHVQQFPPQQLLAAGRAYSLQQSAETGGGRRGFLNTSGDQVKTTDSNGSSTFPNQRWLFEPVSCDHALGSGSSNCYRILQQSRNKYLDAYEGSPLGCGSNDCRVVTRSAQNNLTQVWIVRRRGRGPEGGGNAYTLQQAYNGQYLDGYMYGNAVTRPRQHDDSQTWIIREAR